MTTECISFQERAGKPGGGKGILIQNEKVGSLTQGGQQKVVCFGNGQLHDALTPSLICKTLNTMEDPMKIAIASVGFRWNPETPEQ